MMAIVVPVTLLVTWAVIWPLVGWHVAAWHALVACSVAILLVEALALSIDFIPFTRAYWPGHAKLKTRWPIYLIGMWAFAYWPVQLELRMLGNPAALLKLVACLAVAIASLEIVGRRRARAWLVQPAEDPADELSGVTVLDLGNVAQGAPVGR